MFGPRTTSTPVPLAAGLTGEVVTAAARVRRAIGVLGVELAATGAAIQLAEVDEARALFVGAFLSVHRNSLRKAECPPYFDFCGGKIRLELRLEHQCLGNDRS